MKTLSHLCIVAITATALFSSCKKSQAPAPDETTSMKITANGNDFSFNNCEEILVGVNGSQHATFVGNNINNGNAGESNFEVDIAHDPATLKAGQTYQAATSFGEADAVNFFYYPNTTSSFVSQPANPQGSVTITRVTATTISGTFSGQLFASDDFGGLTVLYTITNGTFTAKINTQSNN